MTTYYWTLYEAGNPLAGFKFRSDADRLMAVLIKDFPELKFELRRS